jgi:hypothetical protein
MLTKGQVLAPNLTLVYLASASSDTLVLVQYFMCMRCRQNVLLHSTPGLSEPLHPFSDASSLFSYLSSPQLRLCPPCATRREILSSE